MYNYPEFTTEIKRRICMHNGCSEYPHNDIVFDEYLFGKSGILTCGESEPDVNGLSVTRFDLGAADAAELGAGLIRVYDKITYDEDGDPIKYETIGYEIG